MLKEGRRYVLAILNVQLPKSALLLILAASQFLLLQNLHSLTLEQTDSLHVPDLTDLALSQDGQWIATAKCNGWYGDCIKGEVQVWEIHNGKKERHVHTLESGISNLSFSPDGSLLTALAKNTLLVWDTSSWNLIYKETPHAEWNKQEEEYKKVGPVQIRTTSWGIRIDELAFSPDGNTFVTVGTSEDRHFLDFWDLTTGTLKKTVTVDGIRNGDPEDIHVRFSPDSRYLAIGGCDLSGAGCGRGNIYIFTSSVGKLWKQLDREWFRADDFTFSPDGQTLVVSTEFNLEIWNINLGKIANKISHSNATGPEIGFSPDGKYLVANGEKLKILDGKTGLSLKKFEIHDGYIGLVRFSHQGELVTYGKDETVRWWKIAR